MEIKRGDIWYVSKDNYTGCEQEAGRPAIIVSNEKNNACAETVEAVSLRWSKRQKTSASVTAGVRICFRSEKSVWNERRALI